MKKGKVVLVGTGFVGMSMAYSMLNQGGRNGYGSWTTICTTKNGYKSWRL